MKLKPLVQTSYSVHVEHECGRNAIVIRYSIEGDTSHVDWSGSRTEELWRGTCFELFFKEEDSENYSELNFAPDGRFCHYELSAYRTIAGTGTGIEHTVEMIRKDESLEIVITATGEDFSSKRLAFSTILADCNGEREFWALTHFDGKPDFHAPELFLPSL